MDAHRYGISISFSARLVPGAGEIFPFGLLTKAPSVWRVDLFSWKNKQLFCPILHCHWRFINESIFLSPLNDREVTVSKFNWILRGTPHTLSRPATFIYLLGSEREMLVMWFLFGIHWAEKTGFQKIFYTAVRLSFLFSCSCLGLIFENLYWISYLFHGVFCFQGENESSSIFTCFMPASTYLFKKLSL